MGLVRSPRSSWLSGQGFSVRWSSEDFHSTNETYTNASQETAARCSCCFFITTPSRRDCTPTRKWSHRILRDSERSGSLSCIRAIFYRHHEGDSWAHAQPDLQQFHCVFLVLPPIQLEGVRASHLLRCLREHVHVRRTFLFSGVCDGVSLRRSILV